jgi:hypothetical protein
MSTTSTVTPDSDYYTPPSISGSNGFHLLQSIKDLTHQELNRANPLGLLGKEIIHATGTTHCPEPVLPRDNDEHSIDRTRTSSSLSTSPQINDEPQQVHFPLNDDEKLHMHRRRSILSNNVDVALPPCPAEFISISDDPHIQPHLFTTLSPTTMLADFIPDTMTINVFEVFIYAWGVFAFFFDMITDLVLAHAYFLEGAYWLFILTLMCVILPNLTLSVFSLVWYIDSSQLKAAAHGQSQIDYRTSQQTSSYQTDDLIDNDNNGRDRVDAHVSRIRRLTLPPEQNTSKKTWQLSTATADILTWIIRIVILVLQLDLCLK